jgi:hypothetical protein
MRWRWWPFVIGLATKAGVEGEARGEMKGEVKREKKGETEGEARGEDERNKKEASSASKTRKIRK